ncbi:phosphoribosylaminoimidazolesuccinocarboxamide synthase [Pullulanibacillus sp. KACC 23026]|uniref:phosphoribosylaminoimidazolesuccinocarboxamide synthase n=1 Tax=Pullulanibacillus sp. KACC 23026 TaxID=3028315 RepID=UPI0023B12165|nr:phosphoribosylaminoimidazolesuccinocarboxamide synthase [Pullulanibacillus sp. KACC 23026]WEG12398.1 phosphoribosylaminoimidazolesuccinocarboxamide synthase [Pullulanibacillus sp. KACC 23026]
MTELLYEGKAKRLYSTDQEFVLRVAYKDDATAFNGEKHAVLTGKGQLNNEISTIMFERLAQAGVPNHFIQKISDNEQLVKAVTIVPIEVIVRNIAAGSMAKRLGLEEGRALKQPIVEFCYKRDDLGDPLITVDHVYELELATPEEVSLLTTMALKVNQVLINYFNDFNITLVDFKLEFGRLKETGELVLADEVSPDTCRLWDKTTGERLDKDVFRKNIGNLQEAYGKLLERIGGNA